MTDFSHLDGEGRAQMVDISDKAVTRRTAVAEGFLSADAALITRLMSGDLPKGDVFAAARLAGIMAAKRTSDLIPLCHPLALAQVEIDFEPAAADKLRLVAAVKTTGRTGVEMEALTAVTVAALTLYDMAKAVDKSIVLGPFRLLEKTGGKSGAYHA